MPYHPTYDSKRYHYVTSHDSKNSVKLCAFEKRHGLLSLTILKNKEKTTADVNITGWLVAR